MLESMKETLRGFRTSDFKDAAQHIKSGIKDTLFGLDAAGLIDIETPVSEKSFLCSGGTMMSVIKLDGYYQLVGNEEFHKLVIGLSNLFKGKLNTEGHFFKVIFEADKEGLAESLSRNFDGVRQHTKQMGIDIEDLIQEKVERNAEYCHTENCFIVCYTNDKVLISSEARLERKDKDEELKGGVSVGHSVNPAKAIESVLNIHNEFVQSIFERFVELRYMVEVLRCDKVLKESVRELFGDEIARNWEPDTLQFGDMATSLQAKRASMKGRRLSGRATKKMDRYLREITADNNKSFEAIFPRCIPEQIAELGMDAIGSKYSIAGNRIYSTVEITKHRESHADFDVLLHSLKSIPYRIAFTITPNGSSGFNLNDTLSDIFSWASAGNKSANYVRKQIASNEEVLNGHGVGFSVTISTWATLESSLDQSGNIKYDLKTIQGNLNRLLAKIGNWGGVVASASLPDPLEGLISTTTGLSRRHISVPVTAPIEDVVALLPITRPSSAWNEGNVLYRTVDGKPIYYQQKSAEQAAWVTLIAGPMGFAKSSQINTLNLAFLTQPTPVSSLPYLRGIDFRYSSRGVVDVIKSGLGQHEKHKAQFVVLENHSKYGYNVFDTMLGQRYPIPAHKIFLNNFLSTITPSLDGYESKNGLINIIINEAYKAGTDEDHNPSAKRYSRRRSPMIGKLVDDLGMNYEDNKTTWWAVVDFLFDEGLTHEAAIAQRFAMPTLTDLSGIASSAAVSVEYSESFNGISVTKAASRAIREAIDSLPFLDGVTQWDISDSPVLILDLAKVVPSGTNLSEKQKVRAATIYMFAMRVLTADFFMDEQTPDSISSKYRRYHSEKISSISNLPKRFFCDERHRIRGIPSAESQADEMIVEGRKLGIDVLQASQLLTHFNADAVKLATTVLLCGATNEEMAQDAVRHYKLNQSCYETLLAIRKPSRRGAEMLAIFDTGKFKKQPLHIVNTEGPKWLAAIATGDADRYVRGQLYLRCQTTAEARGLYANKFPDGNVEPEVRRLSKLIAEGLYSVKNKSLLDDIVDDILTAPRPH